LPAVSYTTVAYRSRDRIPVMTAVVGAIGLGVCSTSTAHLPGARTALDAGPVDFGVRHLERCHNDQGVVYCLLKSPDPPID
jgi:hypothetical protein